MAAPMRFNILVNVKQKMLQNRIQFRNFRLFQCCTVSARNDTTSRQISTASDDVSVAEDEEFRVYEIPGLKKQERVVRKKMRRRPVPPARYLRMPVDQDWTKVWPAAASFKYSVVPFPVRQGFIKNNDENEGVIPGKYANAELMKIPNFLHLTPAHVKKHCAALQKFCTEWPKDLNADNIDEIFPLSVTTYSYCFSGVSLRHPKARVVKVQFKMEELGFDEHAKDKFIRLVGDKYDKASGLVTIEADRCPVKIQNYDYIKYLMTALYYESKKTEPWELEKEESDWERLYWDKSTSRKTLLQVLRSNKKMSDEGNKLLQDINDNSTDEGIVALPAVHNYKKATCELWDGEDTATLKSYKNSVLDVFGLKKY